MAFDFSPVAAGSRPSEHKQALPLFTLNADEFAQHFVTERIKTISFYSLSDVRATTERDRQVAIPRDDSWPAYQQGDKLKECRSSFHWQVTQIDESPAYRLMLKVSALGGGQGASTAQNKELVDANKIMGKDAFKQLKAVVKEYGINETLYKYLTSSFPEMDKALIVLAENGADFKANLHGKAYLGIACFEPKVWWKDQIALCRGLLKAGAEFNANWNGMPLIFVAALKLRHEVEKSDKKSENASLSAPSIFETIFALLLEHKADPNASISKAKAEEGGQSYEGTCVIEHIVRCQKLPLLKSLIAAGARPTPACLQGAVQTGNKDFISGAVDLMIASSKQSGNPPLLALLQEACILGQPDLVQKVLATGAKPDELDADFYILLLDSIQAILPPKNLDNSRFVKVAKMIMYKILVNLDDGITEKLKQTNQTDTLKRNLLNCFISSKVCFLFFHEEEPDVKLRRQDLIDRLSAELNKILKKADFFSQSSLDEEKTQEWIQDTIGNWIAKEQSDERKKTAEQERFEKELALKEKEIDQREASARQDRFERRLAQQNMAQAERERQALLTHQNKQLKKLRYDIKQL